MSNDLRLRDSSAASQRQLMLAVLESKGPTTVQSFQKDYGILDPRPRVHELRWEFNKNIVTHRKKIRDKYGNTRLVGEYALLGGTWRAE